jgi:hypothetical protein
MIDGTRFRPAIASRYQSRRNTAAWSIARISGR